MDALVLPCNLPASVSGDFFFVLNIVSSHALSWITVKTEYTIHSLLADAAFLHASLKQKARQQGDSFSVDRFCSIDTEQNLFHQA